MDFSPVEELIVVLLLVSSWKYPGLTQHRPASRQAAPATNEMRVNGGFPQVSAHRPCPLHAPRDFVAALAYQIFPTLFSRHTLRRSGSICATPLAGRGGKVPALRRHQPLD